MEKVNRYQNLIVSLLKEYVMPTKPEMPELVDSLICDYETHNFQLLTTGWDGKRNQFIVNFHFQIKPNGKAWLLVNNTDVQIAEELVKKGVPREDIVLGFQPPYARPFTDFAAA
jgi:hypothetical protein